jgi:hypothetical protein
MGRHVLTFAALVALIGAFAVGAPARAQTYPVCMTGGYDIGNAHCDFSTYDQCRATASGIGGTCMDNPLYKAEPAVAASVGVVSPRRPAKRRR